MIYKFQPFSVSKELGREYNAHCALVPNPEDWILILDYDVLILDPAAYGLMEQAIARYPDTDIFTARANRIGYNWQRIIKDVDPDPDIRNHLLRAKQRTLDFPDGLCSDVVTAAGFFLLFRKRYWMENPFQARIYVNHKLFDYNFCYQAQRKRTIKLIEGVYCWHTYRILQPDYRNTKHLV